MIDGFKQEYLESAPYLKSLTKKNMWGSLEMPPGHWGALEIFFKGYSTKLALFYKGEGGFRWLRLFSFLENFGKFGRIIIDAIFNFPRFVKGQELFKTGCIPLKYLSEFDVCIGKPFHKNLPVEYIEIREIDKTGHKYGTKSGELKKIVGKVDRKISKMDFDIILSDHGMVDITGTARVSKTENCFIDSDMARYWGSKEELEKIKRELPLKDGKIIEWPDKRFGQLIFVAKTGVLILPNFWQGGKKVKAMHGYDGKHKEMKAFYIINKKGKKKDLKVEQLHEIFKKMLRKREDEAKKTRGP
jgi:hypothetical protein